MTYFSQWGQDQYLNENIFRHMENGYFVDIGAYDGVDLSNTYFFETRKHWNGICVEPVPAVYERLRQNRRCICIQGAVAEEEGERDFLHVQGPLEMLSGLAGKYDPRHEEQIQHALQAYGGDLDLIRVRTHSLQSILDEHKVDHIDLLSIDTEGAELSVLHSLDFQRVTVECIVVENNYREPAVEHYLAEMGFERIAALELDDIFLNRQSRFYPADRRATE